MSFKTRMEDPVRHADHRFRRLAAANRSRVSIFVLVIDHVNIFLTSSLITEQNLGVVFHMCPHVRSQNLGDAGAPPQSNWAWVTPTNTLFHVFITSNLVAI